MLTIVDDDLTIIALFSPVGCASHLPLDFLDNNVHFATFYASITIRVEFRGRLHSVYMRVPVVAEL